MFIKKSTIIKRSILVVISFFLLQVNAWAEPQSRFTVSGYVYEKGSRESLIGVNVYEPNLRVGASTNTYGFYAITLAADTIELFFSYVGYQTQVHTLNLTSNIRLDIELDSSISLDEFVITDERINRISNTSQMSRLDVPILQAQKVPSFFGEKDMFKVLQLMPGVQSGTEGTSGFYVRGGGPDQNLIILDDATVYNASHLFGFFSVFNGDAIKNMQLYKGGFPARFGGRLSSVLDIQMKDGNKEKFAGEAGIGLISSRLTLEGPIIKDKASFLVSGRRTYLDVLIRPFLPSDTDFGYYFYDLNAKLNYDVNPNHKLFASGYFGQDNFFFRYKESYPGYQSEDEGGLYWQNATTTLRWNHLISNNLFANTSLIFSDYTMSIYAEMIEQDLVEKEKMTYFLEYKSGIRDFGLKYDISWTPLPNHHIRAGVKSINHRFTPTAFVMRDDYFGERTQTSQVYDSFESGIYVEDEISFGDFLKINPGLRLSHFYAEGKSYWKPEPRFSSNVVLFPDFSWKLSYAQMNQYVHLLSTTGIGLPTDLWVPSTDQIKPQEVWQLATGFAYDWLNPAIELSVEGYYKKADNIIGYKEGATFLMIDDPSNAEQFSWQNQITSGEAWSYGMEFLLHRKAGKLSGWVGYTLSWTQHRFDEVNFGEKFFARYDRRHDVSVVGIYELNSRMTLSGTWVYATGNSFDLAAGYFPINRHAMFDQDLRPANESFFGPGNNYYDNNTGSIYNEKNAFRAAPYHRLDLAFQIHKDINVFGSRVNRTVELGFYNAYNRGNPFFYYWSSDYYYHAPEQNRPDRKLKQVSLFPIVPSISVNYKF